MAHEPPINTKLVAADLLTYIYPVGSIYMSTVNTSPASFLGGTWSAIQDRTLIGAGNLYTATNTGGAATASVTTTEMPSHTHTWSNAPSVSTHTHLVGRDQDYGTGTNTYSIRTSGTTSPNSPTNSNGAHSHTVSGTLVTDASWTGSSFSILNPYYGVYMWRRTA